MSNVICAIAKNENKYINNWCQYHLNLGFDHIYLYDNNDSTTANVLDFIDCAIQDKITIFNVNNVHKAGFQNECYTKFYLDYKSTFNWCAFIDIDEFIELPKGKKITEFLNNPIFKNFEAIRLKWHLYGDDDIITRDMSIPVQNFFKKQCNTHKFSNFSKSIIRGNLSRITIKSSHCGNRDGKLLKQCNSIGQTTTDFYVVAPHKEAAWINHYMTKTLEEFLIQKYKRTDCQFEKRQLDLDYFWGLNKKTAEKEKFIENFLKGNN